MAAGSALAAGGAVVAPGARAVTAVRRGALGARGDSPRVPPGYEFRIGPDEERASVTPLPGRFTPSNDPHDFLKTQIANGYLEMFR